MYIILYSNKHTEDWSMMLKIQLCITGINYILQYIQTENSYFKILPLIRYFD